jgi:UDP-3-O-[3-hydroxymyristoyl] glucosamine N-acyltransferase
MSIGLNEILLYFDDKNIKYEFTGNRHISFSSFCPLNELNGDSITWVRNAADVPVEAMNSMNNILLIAELGSEVKGAEFPILYVENVHRSFFCVLEKFFSECDPVKRKAKIELSAVVDTADIGKEVYIGHHTYIGPKVKIGNNVIIYHNVTIDGNVSIGNDTVIESGVSIGGDGTGFYKDDNGNLIHVPHYGGIIIGSNVWIGSNSVIIRGCLGDTIIGDGTKISDLCCISHNDSIGRNTEITCGTFIAGSSAVGENVWIAPGTVINNSAHIGKGSYVGIGSVVLSKVKPNTKVFGYPAVKYKFDGSD